MINLYQEKSTGEQATSLLEPVKKLLSFLRITGDSGILQKIDNSLPEKNKKQNLTPQNCVLELNLDKECYVNYSVPASDKKIANLFNQPVKQEFLTLLETIKIASEDQNIKCLLVKLGNNSNFGLSQIYELVEVLKTFKSKGKKTVCYAEVLGFGSTGILTNYLASVFDKVFVMPVSLVCIQGFQARKSFAKQTLKKLGVNLEVFRRKNYKNALNFLNEEKFTKEDEETILDIFQTVEDHIKNELATARNLDLEKINELVQEGPYTSQEAYQQGLIDGVKHRDEVYTYIQEELFKDTKLNYLFFKKYQAKKGGLYSKQGKNSKQVVMINACGPIMEGDSKTPDMFSDDLQIGSDTLTQQIRKAAENKNVIGLILRVDSPGGSAFASEIILREIENFQKKNKKVLALYSNVAASGGVYMSCKADRIICSPLTITGSIGVIMGHFNFREMWSKVGVTFDETRTQNTPVSNIFSITDDTTEKDSERINFFLDECYSQFKQHVQTGRKFTEEQIENHAQGRVWMGTQAQDKNLVDNIKQGGYLDALQHMSEMTDTPVKDIKLVKYPEEKTLLASLTSKPAENEKEQDQKVSLNSQRLNLKNFGQRALLQTVFGQYISQDFVTKMMQQSLNKGSNDVYAFSFESAFLQSAFVQPNLQQLF